MTACQLERRDTKRGLRAAEGPNLQRWGHTELRSTGCGDKRGWEHGSCGAAPWKPLPRANGFCTGVTAHMLTQTPGCTMITALGSSESTLWLCRCLQELNNRLAAEISRLRTLLTGDAGGEAAGSPLTQGKDAYELEVWLRARSLQLAAHELHVGPGVAPAYGKTQVMPGHEENS